MKIKFLFSLILFACGLGAQAQGDSRIGFKAGYTSATIFGKETTQLSPAGSPASLLGFHVGVFVNSKISKHFWIKSEVLAIQKGSIIKRFDDSGQPYAANFKSLYIDLYPISPTYHIKGFQLLAGPYVSVLLTSTIQQKDSNGSLQTTTNFGSGSQLNGRQKLDAGYVLGIEYESKWGISIGARYTHGLVELFEDLSTIVQSQKGISFQQIYNQSISVSIGYSLGRHKPKK